ncbi:MAG: hypothetical protein AAGA11_09520 [Pseudomonadota bacterium]
MLVQHGTEVEVVAVVVDAIAKAHVGGTVEAQGRAAREPGVCVVHGPLQPGAVVRQALHGGEAETALGDVLCGPRQVGLQIAQAFDAVHGVLEHHIVAVHFGHVGQHLSTEVRVHRLQALHCGRFADR